MEVSANLFKLVSESLTETVQSTLRKYCILKGNVLTYSHLSRAGNLRSGCRILPCWAVVRDFWWLVDYSHSLRVESSESRE